MNIGSAGHPQVPDEHDQMGDIDVG